MQSIPWAADAQDKIVQIDIGVSMGYSKSEFFGSIVDNRTDPYYSPDAYFVGHNSITASLQAKVTVFDYFFFRQYISYIEKGGEEINTRFSYHVQAQLNYISLPMLIGFQPINFKNIEWVNIYIEGGVVPNFMLELKSEYIKDGYMQPPEIQDFVWAYQVGAGAEVRLSKQVKLYGNYSYTKDTEPFFEVYKNDDYQILNKSTAWQLGLMVNLK